LVDRSLHFASYLSATMEKSLRLDRVKEQLAACGLNQATVAKRLGLSRTAVSKWFNGTAFPRPAELLKFGKLLGLSFKELVDSGPAKTAPLVAFRKRAGTKTTVEHTEKAREMGRLLEALVPHVGFDRFVTPQRLKQPQLEYDYLQALVTKVRLELELPPTQPIGFEVLIKKFNELQAVIVPVMWGHRSGHANALHIYLPSSQTTWILLNLDSDLYDFKFWMAHELGHVLSVSLLESGDTEVAEDFADAFAGALLFPQGAAKKWLLGYQSAKTPAGRAKVLKEAATEFVISPFSVYKEFEKLAKFESSPFTTLDEKYLHSEISRFNQKVTTISEQMFDGDKPSADRYMRLADEWFDTPFFKALGQHVKKSEISHSVISRMLDIPLVDAREIHEALA